MRAVFQTQPEVSHVYLGSKRHILERIFSDENEPFWRSAKQLELGADPAGEVRVVPAASASRTPSKRIDRGRARAAARGDTAGTRTRRRSSRTSSWELVSRGRPRSKPTSRRRSRRCSGRSRTTSRSCGTTRAQRSGSLLLALADEPTARVYSADYHSRHELPPNPTLQTALAALVRKELVGRGDDGG